MFQNHSNKSRTQILDLVDESSQPSVLSLSDLQLVKGGLTIATTRLHPCSCAVGGGEDWD